MNGQTTPRGELLARLAPALQPLPAPGKGETAQRWRALHDAAAISPSIGRLVEAHHDAVAILDEANVRTDPTILHAVWAAGGPDPLTLTRRGNAWRLIGTKHWCSGAMTCGRALVTADLNGTGVLLNIGLDHDGIEPQASSWMSPTFDEVDTRSVAFDMDVSNAAVVGVDDWYLKRPGFWHGAVGVAACWAGAVVGIVERLRPTWRDDPHAMAHLGAIDAQVWGMSAVLEASAAEIDAASGEDERRRRQRALRVRHLIDTAAADISSRVARALGPGPLAHTNGIHRELAEVELYRRQSHAERDLESLGRTLLQPARTEIPRRPFDR